MKHIMVYDEKNNFYTKKLQYLYLKNSIIILKKYGGMAMKDFANYEFSENEYIEIHDTYEDNSIIDTYNENDFEVEVEEVKIDDTYTE